MQVRLVTRPDDLAGLRPAWDRLYGRAVGRNVFLSHAWLDAAWQWSGREASLFLLCCENAGELVGVLPLQLRKDTRSTLRPRTLEFVSVPDTQRCDVLLDAAHAEPALVALADALSSRARQWDAIRLRHLAPDALITTRLAPLLAQRGLVVREREVARNPWIGLGGDWATFYGGRSRRLKKAVNLAQNRMGRAGAVSIDWLAPGTGRLEDVDRRVADITDISARSWKSDTGNSLDREGPNAFLRRLCHRAHGEGWLSIFTLAIDGRPVAMELQLVDADVYALRADFDRALDEYSPGSHLSRHLLEGLFGKGLRRYYMGPGDNSYKYRWAEDSEAVHATVVYGRSARARLLAAWELALKPAARHLRDRLRRRASRPEPAEAEDK